MRRYAMHFMTAVVTTITLAANAVAQSAAWPDKPVKLVVPFAAGGATDLVARPWAEVLGAAFKQQFIVENRGGASGMIGAEFVSKSAPDGATLFFASNSPLTLVPLLRKTPYDTQSFEIVARAGDVVSGFVIHPASGIKTMAEMMDFARKNPGKLSYGSSGPGTSTHLRLEMLKAKTGLDILHVPYRGGADALNDLLANTIQLMNEASTLAHVKAGKLILLSISHPERFAEFPNIPTLAETGVKGADVPIWYGVWAPAGTPKEITAKLNAKMTEISKSPEMRARLQSVGAVPAFMSQEELVKFWAKDREINAELIRSANIKIE